MDQHPTAAGVDSPGLLAGRLDASAYARNFCDVQAPLTPGQAHIEAQRCHYCFDAPCIQACPTSIDIPAFVHRIAQGNARGAAQTILEANPLGGMCARVCPTEVLCEQACVRSAQEDKPVEIGRLQRFATDWVQQSHPGAPLFVRAATTGKRVAVVGAGPAGLSAAHRLARLGHEVVIFDAHAKPGGLNEYGLATYKTADDFAQREVAWLLSIGGIELRCGQALGREVLLPNLVAEFDAVFLGIGLAGVNRLGLADEPTLPGLRAAVDFIAELRQAANPAEVVVGRQVLVIGGGMTAVDAAVQAKRLGAREVSIVYRRGPLDMPASLTEQAWAQENGVTIRHWAAPKAVLHEGGRLLGLRLAVTQSAGGPLLETGEQFELPADMVLKAIGQSLVADPLGDCLALQQGRIATDAAGRSSHPRIWAGGDCRLGGLDLTVQAVAHGQQAALSIHEALSA